MSSFIDNAIGIGILLSIALIIWSKVTDKTIPEAVQDIKSIFGE